MSFNTLPKENLQHIISYLEWNSILSLRVSNSSLNQTLDTLHSDCAIMKKIRQTTSYYNLPQNIFNSYQYNSIFLFKLFLRYVDINYVSKVDSYISTYRSIFDEICMEGKIEFIKTYCETFKLDFLIDDMGLDQILIGICAKNQFDTASYILERITKIEPDIIHNKLLHSSISYAFDEINSNYSNIAASKYLINLPNNLDIGKYIWGFNHIYIYEDDIKSLFISYMDDPVGDEHSSFIKSICDKLSYKDKLLPEVKKYDIYWMDSPGADIRQDFLISCLKS